jgi:D-amino peptidase
VSEFLLNAYAAGDLNVPIILVAGEAQLLEDDVKRYTPWAETVALKHSLSRVSAVSASMTKIEKELQEATKNAVTKFKQKSVKPLITKKPVKIQVTFSTTHFADAAELLSFVKRIDGLTVTYEAKNVSEAYKTFELLALAATGVSAIIESSQ